jgi:hypothetical protein
VIPPRDSNLPRRATTDEVDPGPPIAELAGLAEPPSPAFVTRVLDGVNRKRTAGQMLEVTWWGWTDLLLEFVRMLFGVFGRRDDSERTERKE